MSVTLHMVASLDGFIAKHDADLSWMEVAWGDYSAGSEMTMEVLDSIDCYIMGARTYELALELGWPYGDKQTVVVSKRQLPSTRDCVEFFKGDLPTLVEKLGSKNSWLVGGPALSRAFFDLQLVDHMCLTLVPVLLGDGIRLHTGGEQKLQLTSTKAFKNGMIDLWYDVLRGA